MSPPSLAPSGVLLKANPQLANLSFPPIRALPSEDTYVLLVASKEKPKGSQPFHGALSFPPLRKLLPGCDGSFTHHLLLGVPNRPHDPQPMLRVHCTSSELTVGYIRRQLLICHFEGTLSWLAHVGSKSPVGHSAPPILPTPSRGPGHPDGKDHHHGAHDLEPAAPCLLPHRGVRQRGHQLLLLACPFGVPRAMNV